MAPRVVSSIHRIPSNARFGVLLIDADEARLGEWTESLVRADRTVVPTSSSKEAFAALASGFVPDVVVAAIAYAADVFGTMSAMPKFRATRFVAVTVDGFDAGDGDRLASVVDAYLREPREDE